MDELLVSMRQYYEIKIISISYFYQSNKMNQSTIKSDLSPSGLLHDLIIQ